MTKDIWHFPRTELARQVLGMFESGLSNALVFFAPRRMGKTEFLLKDIKPLAIKKRWKVHYFSFFEVVNEAKSDFTTSLVNYVIKDNKNKGSKLFKNFKRVDGSIGGSSFGIKASIEFKDKAHVQMTLKQAFDYLIDQDKKKLLLMDQSQIHAMNPSNKEFVAYLRTILDVNKDKIKVIFTGSSREGLRNMFSKSDAPFFHYGQNLDFPEFNEEFVEHMCKTYNKATKRKLNQSELYKLFCELDKVPQLFRSLIERLALNPNLKPSQAKELLLSELIEDREYIIKWKECNELEKKLLSLIADKQREIFKEDTRRMIAHELLIDQLPVSRLQSSIRTLIKRGVIGKSPEHGKYFIDDPNFGKWILNIKK